MYRTAPGMTVRVKGARERENKPTVSTSIKPVVPTSRKRRPHLKIKPKTVKAAKTKVAIPDHWAYWIKSACENIDITSKTKVGNLKAY